MTHKAKDFELLSAIQGHTGHLVLFSHELMKAGKKFLNMDSSSCLSDQ